MKKFVEYLVEGVHTYTYRIKIAGVQSESCILRMEKLLDRYGLESFGTPKVTPVQEHPMGFNPVIKNMEITIVDIETAYPASMTEIRNLIANCVMLPESYVVVETDMEPVEEEDGEYEPLLTKEYEKGVDSKDYYGDEYNAGMLKELLKQRDEASE